MTRLAKPGLIALAFVVAACGGSTFSSTDGGTAGSGGFGATGASGGSGGSGATGATGGSGGSSPVGCPATPPTVGQACSPSDLRCTYGNSVRPDCREAWLCKDKKWTTTQTVCAHSTGCPSNPPATGTICAVESQVCDYSNGTLCLCTSCSAGPCGPPPPKWQCALPPSNPGCPPIVPNDGSTCTAPADTMCHYGTPCGPSSAIVKCSDGTWTWQPPAICAN